MNENVFGITLHYSLASVNIKWNLEFRKIR